MNIKSLIILLLSFFALNHLYAQGVKVTASAPKVVASGEQFRLTYSVNQKPEAFKHPDLSKFNARGPSTSSSSSVQIVNGNVSQKVTYSYTYYLSSTTPGKYTIAPASVKFKGKSYNSNPVSIEVVKGSAVGATAGQQNNKSGKGGGSGTNLFARIILNKRSAFIGEQIIAKIKIYTKANLAGFEQQPKFPSYSGFLVQEIEGAQQIQLNRENVGGEVYDTGVLQEVLLYPQRTGKITIEPAELACIIRQKVRQRSFFDSGYRDRRVDIKTPAVNITIKPLPFAGKPEDFSGAVGKFNFSAKINKDKVQTNDAITLDVKISGNGNIKLIEPPKITFPSDFESYKPETKINVKPSRGGSTGTKSFKYLIIPRHAGDFTIPPIKFSYFDMASKTYKIVSSEQFNIQVTKGNNENQNVQYYSGGKEAVKTIDVDVRHIKTGESYFTPIDSMFSGTRNFYFIYLGALLIFLIISIVRWKKIKENSNIARMKNKKANKISRKRLRKASNCLKTNNNEEFYDEILAALWGYLGDKLNISPSELNKENIKHILVKKNIEEDTTNELLGIIDKCEFAKYAPSAVADEKNDIYKQTSNIISTLDSKLK